MNNTKIISLDNLIVENLFMQICKNNIYLYLDSKQKYSLYLHLTIKKHSGFILNNKDNLHYIKILNNFTFSNKHYKLYYLIYNKIFNDNPSHINNDIQLFINDNTVFFNNNEQITNIILSKNQPIDVIITPIVNISNNTIIIKWYIKQMIIYKINNIKINDTDDGYLADTELSES